MQLVLSLFPGIGLLDRAFELAWFCVVRGPDLLWGGAIEGFHPPAGKFAGVIGGPPCQIFSEAGQLKSRKQKSRRINLIPEFERCVGESGPAWFLMENTRRAPLPVVAGFEVADYLLNNRWFGAEQNRVRRFSFGTRGVKVSLPIQPAAIHAEKVKRCVLASDGKRAGKGQNFYNRQHTMSASVYSFEDACEMQGLPRDYLRDAPFTKEGKYRVVGNGVPLPMGLAVAIAIEEVTRGLGR